MQVEDFDRAVSALFSQGSAAVNPATRCEAEQYLRGRLRLFLIFLFQLFR